MTQPAILKKELLRNCLSWFQEDFSPSIISLLRNLFPGYPLPGEVQSVLESWEQAHTLVEGASAVAIDLATLFPELPTARLFKQIVLRYRRYRAAQTEGYREKTFHAGIIQTLEEDINSLDALVETDWFQAIEPLRLPRARDFLPVQYVEHSALGQSALAPRQYDEKFHILQSPALFLADLAHFRARCEARDVPLTIAFLDIDDFKTFNSAHGETKVDRNLLPHFMQTLEAHVYHHGFAYRQGGDEYLVLLPSFSKELAVAFLDELRCKLAAMRYPEIDTAPTVTIGACLAEPDCPLTDRELRDRANQAKTFAKERGKNCIAVYEGPRLASDELRVLRPESAGLTTGGAGESTRKTKARKR